MRTHGKLLWREIEDVLAQEIASGIFSAGARLPIEPELALRFGVNRHTVRRALAALEERGIISIEQGRGMFVRAPKLAYPIGKRVRYAENIARLNKVLTGRLVRSWETPATPALARDLKIEEGAMCLVLDDLREIDGEPISITSHYFPAERFAGIGEAFSEERSITEALKRFGVDDYHRKTTRVHVRSATLEEAAALQVRHESAILVVEAVNVDQSGTPIEFGDARSAEGRFELIYET